MNYPITFGKYQLLERVNIGGMAEVFKAKAFGIEGFERILAIKRILPNMADDDEFINMFVDEARIAVQLAHPNIVQIYELGKFENQYYIAMEYVSGRDLRQLLDLYRKKEALLPVQAAVFVASQLCEGLDYAHRRKDAGGRQLNLVHRDVSPQNILLGYDGSVKITDFGIAKAEDRASKTQAGVLKGKFGYMSPEQVRGLEVDQRSDVFAVGILLYEMITGKRLFVGQSDFSTLERVRNAEVPAPRQHNGEIPEALEKVMLKALARDRDERYLYASDLHDELQQFLINGTTLFNGKRLAELMTEQYQEEINEEYRKMEEFRKVKPPTSFEDLNQAAQMRSAPTGTWSPEMRGEKTMIFESAGFAADALSAGTQQGSGVGLASQAKSLSGSVSSVGPRGFTRAEKLHSKISVAKPTNLRRLTTASTVPGRQRRTALLMLSSGLVLLLLLGVLLYLLLSGSHPTGTIIVTTLPTDAVEVYLDGELIGSKTPLTRPNIPTGPHTLVLRATGYADKAFRFELAAGAPAVINAEMTRTKFDEVADGVIEVVSDPSGASVLIAGLPQGVTPVSLRGQDVSRPIILEVRKEGYQTQMVTVSFVAGERQKTVRVTLPANAVASQKPVNGGDAATGTPSTAPAAGAGAEAAKSGQATLVVQSTPMGARVLVDGKEEGETPLELTKLDSAKTYEVRLVLRGHQPLTQSVKMGGRDKVTVSMVLQAERAAAVPEERTTSVVPQGCQGKGSRLSVMSVGVADCEVFVGKTSLGIAPIFNKEAPLGRCTISVQCPGSKRYQTTRVLRSGKPEKVVIQPGDWR